MPRDFKITSTKSSKINRLITARNADWILVSCLLGINLMWEEYSHLGGKYLPPLQKSRLRNKKWAKPREDLKARALKRRAHVKWKNPQLSVHWLELRFLHLVKQPKPQRVITMKLVFHVRLYLSLLWGIFVGSSENIHLNVHDTGNSSLLVASCDSLSPQEPGSSLFSFSMHYS